MKGLQVLNTTVFGFSRPPRTVTLIRQLGKRQRRLATTRHHRLNTALDRQSLLRTRLRFRSTRRRHITIIIGSPFFDDFQQHLDIISSRTVPTPKVFRTVIRAFFNTRTLRGLRVQLTMLHTRIPRQVIHTRLRTPVLTSGPILLRRLTGGLQRQTHARGPLTRALTRTHRFQPRTRAARPHNITVFTLFSLVGLTISAISQDIRIRGHCTMRRTNRIGKKIVSRWIRLRRGQFTSNFVTNGNRSLGNIKRTHSVRAGWQFIS